MAVYIIYLISPLKRLVTQRLLVYGMLIRVHLNPGEISADLPNHCHSGVDIKPTLPLYCNAEGAVAGFCYESDNNSNEYDPKCAM